MIQLIGPGGAGKSTIGAALADRLGVPFVDLDAAIARKRLTTTRHAGREANNEWCIGADPAGTEERATAPLVEQAPDQSCVIPVEAFAKRGFADWTFD